MTTRYAGSVIILAGFLLAACSSSLPTQSAASGVTLSASPVYADTERYIKPGVDFRKYAKFMIDPADIYQGPDAQFADVPMQDRTQLAAFLSSEFARVLSQKYQIVTAPGPDVLRLHLTLAGIVETDPALATVTHMVPAGLAMNLMKGATDSGSGSFTGSATYSGNIYDSTTNVLVAAFVTKQGPNAMNLTALFSGLDAAKAGVTGGAEKFLAGFDKLRSGT